MVGSSIIPKMKKKKKKMITSWYWYQKLQQDIYKGKSCKWLYTV